MYKIRLICAGKLREQYFKDAADEYLKRLRRFCLPEVVEVPECTFGTPESMLLSEEGGFLSALFGYVVVLTPEGAKLSSEGFSALVSDVKDKEGKLSIVIGSSNGLSAAVKKRADKLVSFSDMTFPHTLMRVIALEQLYRAFMISGGGTYHK